jgi:2-polyprenyl-3-methyl-5-hydroxy-6-metoxy-1,4-benzoquinol methylase
MDRTEFSYKEMDDEGLDTLNVIAAADKFNHWMYSTIQPFLKGEVLEIGGGIGNITQFVLRDGFQLTTSDIRDLYCSVLQDKFASDPNLRAVVKIDIVHPDFDQVYKNLLDKFDSIFALNIVEHVENDALAVQNCKKLLRTNGNLIILVPAYQMLYNRFDRELEHFRRYTRKSLEQLFVDAGLRIRKTQYFNFAGIAGWWFTGRILHKKTIPEGQMQLYNRLVPLFKIVDRLVFSKAGLSVICFGTKD